MSSTKQDKRCGRVERSIDGKHLTRLFWDPAHGTCAERILDDRDQATVDERMAAIDTLVGPRVGDFVVFADGTERRISASWPAAVQTSDIRGGLYSGRWYLGRFGVSYSGGLHGAVSVEALTDTGETRDGWAWIFHHDAHRAGNGVDFRAPFRVYRCEMTAAGAEAAEEARFAAAEPGRDRRIAENLFTQACRVTELWSAGEDVGDAVAALGTAVEAERARRGEGDAGAMGTDDGLGAGE